MGRTTRECGVPGEGRTATVSAQPGSTRPSSSAPGASGSRWDAAIPVQNLTAAASDFFRRSLSTPSPPSNRLGRPRPGCPTRPECPPSGPGLRRSGHDRKPRRSRTFSPNTAKPSPERCDPGPRGRFEPSQAGPNGATVLTRGLRRHGIHMIRSMTESAILSASALLSSDPCRSLSGPSRSRLGSPGRLTQRTFVSLLLSWAS